MIFTPVLDIYGVPAELMNTGCIAAMLEQARVLPGVIGFTTDSGSVRVWMNNWPLAYKSFYHFQRSSWASLGLCLSWAMPVDMYYGYGCNQYPIIPLLL